MKKYLRNFVVGAGLCGLLGGLSGCSKDNPVNASDSVEDTVKTVVEVDTIHVNVNVESQDTIYVNVRETAAVDTDYVGRIERFYRNNGYTTTTGGGISDVLIKMNDTIVSGIFDYSTSKPLILTPKISVRQLSDPLPNCWILFYAERNEKDSTVITHSDGGRGKLFYETLDNNVEQILQERSNGLSSLEKRM